MKKHKQLQPIQRLQPAPEAGLTQAQVEERIRMGWTNEAATPSSKSVGQIVASNVFTFFNLVFTVLALCLVLVQSWENLLFMGVVVLNTLIGIVQEIRAKRTLDRLTVLSEATVRTVREGKAWNMPVQSLVVDDIVMLEAGNQVCADAVVLTGEVEVNESLLTGEADTMVKHPGEQLLSGSFVVSGQCHARLEQVGQDSYAAQITREARKHKRVRSGMMRALDRLLRVIAVIIVPFGLILFFKEWWFMKGSIQEAVVSMVASAVGMIPEGLYLLTSVALAVSVIQLAKHNTLVHELSCIETLARVDVLCLDKTGTITEGSMQVQRIETLWGQENWVMGILAAYCAASQDANATAQALQAHVQDRPVPSWTAQGQMPFSSQRKWGCVDFGQEGVYVLGAPEFILGGAYDSLKSKVEADLHQGLRVLLLAQCAALPTADTLGQPVQTLALIALSDKLRASAPQTLAYFREQGVALKVISGDNPLTVSQVAKRAGIQGAEYTVDAQTLYTEADFDRAVQDGVVFGRVTPQQKRMLVAALKRQGHTVAMTGDGVNDVLALKDADCSIAMAAGSQAAANVSHLVLLDSDFASLPKTVNEGRRVIHNIERSASLFLVKNIFSFLVTLLLLFLPLSYPFAPIQLTLVSSLTIGIPAFFLALEPTYRQIQGGFMGNVLRRALPGGLTDAWVLLAVLAASALCKLDSTMASAICTIVAGLTGLMVLYLTCRPWTRLRMVLWTAMTLAMAAAIVVTWPMLVGGPLPGSGWAILSCALVAIPLSVLGLTRLVEIGFKRYEKRKNA